VKIEKVHLENHPLFGTMDIDFTGHDKKALDTIVIAGVNGTGKTTLLIAILKIINTDNDDFWHSYLKVDFSHLPGFKGRMKVGKINVDWLSLSIGEFKHIDEEIRPRLIYMPTEINFEGLKIKNLSLSSQYSFINIVNQETIDDVPSFIASTINSEVYKNPDLPAKQAIDKVCNDINSLFDILEIDAKMVGLKPEGEKLPIFKNSAGKIFDINHLSSGEKQLFVRALALRMLNANNSVILIDEPEISMHPRWQQRIVNVYQKIGNNNQLIIATHSPHVVASVPKESVKLLKRENGKIKVVEYDEINGSYGLPVDIVLKELMELDTLRDPEVEKEIRALWDMLHQKKHHTEDFNERYLQLEKLLGSEDEELLLMRIEIAKLRSKREKASVGNKETQ
jgi:predicted ATP-dependent endonuclease of OLD family